MIGPRPDEVPTLILLHEGLGAVSMWRDFPDRLAAATGCGVFAYSRAGYGGSDPVPLPRPLTYMHDEARDVLPDLIAAIGVRRGLLVGHSDGASIAAIYAGSDAANRDRICGLVLMAPHFFVEDVSIKSIAAAKIAYETTDLRERLKRYHGDNVDCAFWGWNGAWLDPGFRAWDIREYLGRIEVPVLVVQGRDDEYGTLAQVHAAEADCTTPVTVEVLEDCGHAPFRDQPEATLAANAAFVRSVVGAEQGSR
ncbi:MAG: alpha/beta hydrolase [Hyphomicrobiales bacterium]|nr:alpha/beta hydrolase [Hyphomicrobiales bacterium]